MASKHDTITWLLQKVGEDDIEIIHRNDEMVVHIKTVAQPKAQAKKGKWAKVAEELSREAPLTGIGDEFLKHTKDFRDNFALRNPFDSKE